MKVYIIIIILLLLFTVFFLYLFISNKKISKCEEESLKLYYPKVSIEISKSLAHKSCIRKYSIFQPNNI